MKQANGKVTPKYNGDDGGQCEPRDDAVKHGGSSPRYTGTEIRLANLLMKVSEVARRPC